MQTQLREQKLILRRIKGHTDKTRETTEYEYCTLKFKGAISNNPLGYSHLTNLLVCKDIKAAIQLLFSSAVLAIRRTQ